MSELPPENVVITLFELLTKHYLYI